MVKYNYITLEEAIKKAEKEEGGQLYPDIYFDNTYFGSCGDPEVLSLIYEYYNETDGHPTMIDDDTVIKFWQDYFVPYYAECAIGTVVGEATDEEKFKEVKTFMRAFSSKLKDTFPRYKTLIDLYEAQESHLLDAIKSQTNANGTNTITNSGTDTLTDTFNTDVENTGTVKNASSGNDTLKNTGTTTLKKTLDEKRAEGKSDTPQNEHWFDPGSAVEPYLTEASRSELSGNPEDMTIDDTEHKTTYGKEDLRTDNTKQSQTGDITHTNNINNSSVNAGTSSNMTLDERESIINRLNDIRAKWDNLYIEWRNNFRDLFIII